MVSGNILASAHGIVGYLQPRGCIFVVAFRHLRASPSSSTCLLYQFPFEYVTLKDNEVYIGGYNSRRALFEFCLC